MLARVRDRLTYANVVSTVCLFVVLGGGAYAAVQLPPKSVGTKQLRNKAVKRVKIAAKAVTGPKIARNAVTGPKVDESSLGRVPEALHATRASDADRLGGSPFDYFEAAQRTQFGTGSQTSVTKDEILAWTNAHAKVLTDGDSDATPAVIVRNTAAPGGGPLHVIADDGTDTLVAQGADSPEILGNAGNVNFVVARPDGRTIWVRCAFPGLPRSPVRCLGERSSAS